MITTEMDPHHRLTGVVLRLALVIGVVVVLYYAKALLIPLVVAALLALLLNPIDEKLRESGWNKYLSIAVCMLVLLTVFGALFFAVGKQASNFADNWPEIKQSLNEQVKSLQESFPVLKQLGGDSEVDSAGELVKEMPTGSLNVGSFFTGTLGILGDFLLMLVYVVILLGHKNRIREFILRRAPDHKRGLTHRTINETRDVARKYLKGRMVLILVLTVLYSIGFSIVGLDYAILIAVLVAVLSIIPYFGNIIGGLLAMAVAVATGGGSSAIIGILVTMSLAQVLESYILLPLIVGDEVDINAMTTIIGVMGFSVLWGPVGAVVAIPLLGMLRILFSHVDGLRDYAYLLGQEKE